jgi:hypothetical protein
LLRGFIAEDEARSLVELGGDVPEVLEGMG